MTRPSVTRRSRIDDATKRSGVAWVEVDGASHLVWQMWHDGRMYVVAGGQEQQLDPPTRARVTVRTKEGPLTWPADVERVQPGSPEWDEVTPALANRRLNAADGPEQPRRWARESVLYRFTPDGQSLPRL